MQSRVTLLAAGLALATGAALAQGTSSTSTPGQTTPPGSLGAPAQATDTSRPGSDAQRSGVPGAGQTVQGGAGTTQQGTSPGTGTGTGTGPTSGATAQGSGTTTPGTATGTQRPGGTAATPSASGQGGTGTMTGAPTTGSTGAASTGTASTGTASTAAGTAAGTAGSAGMASGERFLPRIEQGTQYLGSRLNGADVYGRGDEKIGDIEDIIIDAQGRVVAVVISYGGLAGIGQSYVAVNPSQLRMQRVSDDETRVSTSFTAEDLRSAPSFSYSRR